MEITKEAYSEVYAILNLMSWNSINKIPEEIWENIENKRDKENIIEINNIEEYQVSEQANKLLAVLYKNYFATDEEKEIIKAKEKILYQKEQEELREKFNPDSIFKNEEAKIENVENSVAMVECEESIFTKIKNWFKRFIEYVGIMCKGRYYILPYFFHISRILHKI